uniref:Uncharacterized protein n=1 Tax=Podoviridae sp. ctXdu7 TaxID=2827618 RepID=A0A8S5RRW1_9CAUD|nr:MAG TPA: hypothetical protein [Podoviridae sp. ctXdu7]
MYYLCLFYRVIYSVLWFILFLEIKRRLIRFYKSNQRTE